MTNSPEVFPSDSYMRFNVAANIPAATLINPAQTNKTVVRDGGPYVILSHDPRSAAYFIPTVTNIILMKVIDAVIRNVFITCNAQKRIFQPQQLNLLLT